MKANSILLQRKYARVILMFADKQGLTIAEALDFFYASELYKEVSQGVSDMHCRSDEYLVEELKMEYACTLK